MNKVLIAQHARDKEGLTVEDLRQFLSRIDYLSETETTEALVVKARVGFRQQIKTLSVELERP